MATDRIAKDDDVVKKAPGSSQVIQLASGQPFTVKTSAGVTIFEIRDNGTVHIKLGTLVVADL